MSANRARRIHEIPSRVSTVDLVSQTDLLVLDRLAGGAWDNAAIFSSDLYAQLLAAISASVGSVTLKSEDTYKDNLAVEFFEDYSVGSISAFDKGYGWAANGVGSGCSIVSRTPAGNGSLTQKRLSITSGQYGRKFAWGDSWNRIQLMVLWRLNHGATFGPSQFYFGLCSGTTNMAGDALTDNFIGMRGPNNGATDATFAAGTRVSYFDINPAVRFATKRAGVTTDRGSGSGSNGRHVVATEGWLSLFLLEFSRPTFANDASTPNYSIGRQMTDLTQVEMALGKGTLLDVFKGDIVTGLAGSGHLTLISASGNAGVTVTPFAFDQSTGKLDTFNFTWDQAFGCEIAALGARKIF